jgi:sec-independent protein translocase protein TatC
MKEMSLIDHLNELRNMLVNSLIIIVVGFGVTYSFGVEISEFLLTPLRSSLLSGNGGQVVYTGLLDKVTSELEIAFWSATILTSPVWFYQVWRFVGPALHEHEAKAVKPFLMIGLILFILGVFFGYYVAFPLAFNVFMTSGVTNVSAMISLKDYLSMAIKVLVFLGFMFQVPNVIVILGFMGVVTKYSLRSMRRYIYVGLSVISAMLTPPDVVSMLLVWVPLIVLFELGILAVSLIVHPYLAKKHGI